MNKGFPEPRIVDPMIEAPSWHYEDVPVIDGIATFPDGTTLRSAAAVVRVSVADTLPPVPEDDVEDITLEDVYQSGLLDGEGFIREKYDLVPKGGVLDAVREAYAEWDSGLGAFDEYVAQKLQKLGESQR